MNRCNTCKTTRTCILTRERVFSFTLLLFLLHLFGKRQFYGNAQKENVKKRAF